MTMLSPFSYDLPPDRIAQRPLHPYDAARLLLARRCDGVIGESTFADLGSFLRSGDQLILNDTKVLPARFLGTIEKTGGAIEVLILHEQATCQWECIGKPLKRFRPGMVLCFGDRLRARVEQKLSSERVLLSFFALSGDVHVLMHEVGSMPIPPYIRQGRGDEDDRLDYQTMFAQQEGSVAAPTASLHFTPRLVEGLKARGVGLEFITLHVGAASFLPLWHEEGDEPRKPGIEHFRYSTRILERIKDTRRQGGRVIAVGTTVVRALESMARCAGADEGTLLSTELFINPGHEFKAIDCLITNFHQPRTTHLLLVQALMGEDLLRSSYDYALAHGFRFLSYGDGMLIE